MLACKYKSFIALIVSIKGSRPALSLIVDSKLDYSFIPTPYSPREKWSRTCMVTLLIAFLKPNTSIGISANQVKWLGFLKLKKWTIQHTCHYSHILRRILLCFKYAHKNHPIVWYVLIGPSNYKLFVCI